MINNLKVAYLLINRTALSVHPLSVIVMIFFKSSEIGVTPLPTLPQNISMLILLEKIIFANITKMLILLSECMSAQLLLIFQQKF